MPIIDIIGTATSITSSTGTLATQNDRYRKVFGKMFPRGWAWSIIVGTKLELWVRAVGWELSRIDIRVGQMIEEFSPLTAQETLPEWEEILGLPGDCPNPPTTLDGRQEAAFAKLVESISDNPEYFLRLANTLGYPAAQINLLGDPFTAISECTHSLYGWEGGWIDTWELVAGGSTENDGALECQILEVAQSHTHVLFDFS